MPYVVALPRLDDHTIAVITQKQVLGYTLIDASRGSGGDDD